MEIRITFFLLLTMGFLQCQVNKNYLQFENFRKDTTFPTKELEKYSGEKIRIFVKDTIGRNIIYPGACLSTSSILYGYFIEKDVVSGYVDIYEKEKIPKDQHYVSREEFANRLKKSMKIYYVGEIIEEKPYRSYLFSVYNQTSNIKYKKELMVNIKDDFIKSITLLTETNLSDSGYEQYTVYLGKNKYVHGVKTLYSDVIGVEYKEEEPVGFQIDSKGYVVTY